MKAASEHLCLQPRPTGCSREGHNDTPRGPTPRTQTRRGHLVRVCQINGPQPGWALTALGSRSTMAEGARSGDHPAVFPKRPGAWKTGTGTAAGPTLLFWDSWEPGDFGFWIIPQGRGESRKGALPSQLASFLKRCVSINLETRKTQLKKPKDHRL